MRGERAEEPPSPYTPNRGDPPAARLGLTRQNLGELVTMVEERYCSVAATLPRGLIEHEIVIVDDTTQPTPGAAESAATR